MCVCVCVGGGGGVDVLHVITLVYNNAVKLYRILDFLVPLLFFGGLNNYLHTYM